jgi:Flp pilus assembly protein TadG
MLVPTPKAETIQDARRGAACVELAVLLPILIFCAMAAVDFARVTYVLVALQTCARNGALYEFYTSAQMQIPASWTSLSAATSADAPANLTVTASATSPAASSNNTVTVTATTNFTLIALGALSGLPPITNSMTLSQSVTMPYPPSTGTVP